MNPLNKVLLLVLLGFSVFGISQTIAVEESTVLEPVASSPVVKEKVDTQLLKSIQSSILSSLNYLNNTVGTYSVDVTFCLSASANMLKDSSFGSFATEILKKDISFQKKKYYQDYVKFEKVVNSFQPWGLENEVYKHIQSLKKTENKLKEKESQNTSSNDEKSLDEIVGLNKFKNHKKHGSRRTGKPGLRKRFMESTLHFIPKTSKCHFNENISDNCLQEALSCKLSQKCLSYYTIEERKRGYCLTHQMLYYEFFRRFCPKTQNKTISLATESLKLLSHELLVETDKVKDNGKWSDIWIERYSVGSMVGAYQFIQEDIVRYVINSQLKQGCWKGYDRTSTFSRYLKSKTGDDDLLEYETGNDCTNHTTGLALYYLSAALSYYSQ